MQTAQYLLNVTGLSGLQGSFAAVFAGLRLSSSKLTTRIRSAARNALQKWIKGAKNMQKKIARKLRKDALRRGAILSGEKYVLSKRELRRRGLKPSDNGYCLVLRYKGEVIHVADNTMLWCYRLVLDIMDTIDELGVVCV